MSFVFSPSMVTFYDAGNMEAYVASGSWPTDTVPVEPETVVTYTGTPPEGFQLGVGVDSQPAWVPKPPDPPPTRAHLVAMAIDAGMALESSSHPEINATYALDPDTQKEVQNIAVALSDFGFPGGAETFAYPDKNGTPVMFSEDAFRVLYTSMRSYILALNMYQGEQIPNLPAQPYQVA